MKKRITIDVNGQPRTVIGFKELSTTNDLNIHTTDGGKTFLSDTFRDLVAGTNEQNYQRSDMHISVHNNPKSDEYNTIKKTIEFDDGRKLTDVQVTSGIKKDNLFVPVLFRVCGDLGANRYLLPDNCSDDLVSLGQINPANDQLRFMVVVSKKGKAFPSDNEHPSNTLQLDFTKFSVTFIWSYFNFRSHPHAINIFMGTSKDSGPIRGLEWFEIYNTHTELNIAHINQYFEIYKD